MLQEFWKYYLRRNRWVIVGDYPYHLPKLVIAIAPHTSSWDFIVGLAVRSVLNLFHIRFLGKQELFKPPFGFIFRRLGGTPVNRKSKQNMVEQVVAQFNAVEQFTLALSPEGTRQKVGRLRTGFYQIALQAKVPILPVGFDFAKRQIIVAPPLYPTGNLEEDMDLLLAFWRPIQGRDPSLGLG